MKRAQALGFGVDCNLSTNADPQQMPGGLLLKGQKNSVDDYI